MAGRQKAGDEMFLSSNTYTRPGDASGSSSSDPLVEPLRINKRDTTSPVPSNHSSNSAYFQQNAPQHRASPSLGARASSASPAPLPYPDDRSRQRRPTEGASALPSLPYPDDDDDDDSPTIGTFPRPRNDSRTGSPADYPASLRPRDGRQDQTLAERRGNQNPKPLPDSPGPEIPDKEGLFQRPIGQSSTPQPYHYPAPGGGSAPTPASSIPAGLRVQNPHGINRFDSTASTSTTKAQRGSPPPPETPIVPPGHAGADIESRYAAAGIAGTSTLTSLQAQNVAAHQRTQHYGGNPPPQSARLQSPQQAPPRPWTPTEAPGTQPHGPPTVYQGAGTAASPPQAAPNTSQSPAGGYGQSQHHQGPPANALENDLHRMNLNASPPPAYSSVSAPGVSGSHTAQGYPNEKASASPANVAASAAAAGAAAVAAAHHSPQSSIQNQGHPAFANDPRQQQQPGASPQPGAHNGLAARHSVSSHATGPPTLPSSPPPLPEGWIAHLDPNSGQYYYIHVPTQSTQWEFPKGPTPLNLNDTPLSPVHSTYSGNPLASPGLSAFGKPLASPGVPMTPSVMGFPNEPAGFSGPPPSSGVEIYKVAPTNGVYFGPYLRYTNMDLERGIWLGSVLLITDAPQPPTIHIHQSVDLSPNPRQLKAVNISTHQRWTFYRYDIDLRMEDEGAAKWTYAITSHLGCTRYEFLVAGRHEVGWRFVATSGNDFSLNVNANERAKLGGVGFMWRDIMQKHSECGGFHTQLGLGSQIVADRIWKEIPSLKQWLAMSGKDTRKNAAWTAVHEEDVSHAYFHYYTSHFDQPFLREAFAQIPQICQIDDHDIFDGFGSYPEYMQFSNMFKNIGRIGIEMYLLFQHHTTLEILRNVQDDNDLFTVTGTGWHFVKYLGPAVAVVGPDTRSERNPHQVMAGQTYQGLFPKIATLPQSVQHCILMIALPLVYPRLEAAESIAQTMATGKKAVTGAYNVLGKVTSSVAGVVGAKGAVGSGFDSVKKAIGKSGLMGGILSPFGDIDVLDELKDQWTHDSKDLERTYLIRTLQGIAHNRSIRMTFLSGGVNTCGAGLLHDPSHPADHKTMYQLIASPVVNTPPPSYVVKLLQNAKHPLYVPLNGHRSSNHGAAASTGANVTDTKEDMMEIFRTDVYGTPLKERKLMGRRNYVAIVAYDPEIVQGTFGRSPDSALRGGGRLSLAADFMVQGDAGAAGAAAVPGSAASVGPGSSVQGQPFGTNGVVKYGPVIVPCLDFGR